MEVKVNKKEAEQKASELVNLTRQQNELKAQIKQIKGELLEFVELENLNDYNWMMDNACVEVTTVTTYKLADIPADVKVSPEVAANDIADRAFESKIVLSKEGKKMFKDQQPSIVALMIPKVKKKLKVLM